MELVAADFAEFFVGVHGHQPFPWQQRLVDWLGGRNAWPEVLGLPTGSGKTAALDAAVFHLAMRADDLRLAALRIAFVVDRRIVVDDAYARARKIADALARAALGKESSPVLVEVAERLGNLAERKCNPLVVQRLRGGAPLENDWVRTPTQPTILCSTVDQVGSRLLFRGYGTSDRMRPVHAGLLGQDTLILLDEAHLSQPFRETVDAVRRFGRANVKAVLLTATPGRQSNANTLQLSNEDQSHPVLGPRLSVSKPAKLTRLSRDQPLAKAFAAAARRMLAKLKNSDIQVPAVGVIVNRVKLARDIFRELQDEGVNSLLLIGRCRSTEREMVVAEIEHIKTGVANREMGSPLAIVATQCIEVGVDLDLDGIVTQAAPLDALRQRFGRLNRAGRALQAEAEIICAAEQLSRREQDPIYGDRIRKTWEVLTEIADKQHIDFGIASLDATLQATGVDLEELSSPSDNAPILMPAYLHLWAQTSPVPSADPDIGLFLHGKTPVAPDVSLVWRDDIDDILCPREMGNLLELMPPRAGELLSIPLWAVQNFLRKQVERAEAVADVLHQTTEPGSATAEPISNRVFRWAGASDPKTNWIEAEDIRAGDILVLSTSQGGCDKFGWNPNATATQDIADQAAKPYRSHRHAVRVSPGTVKSKADWSRLKSALAQQDGFADDRLIDSLLAILPADGTGELAESDTGSDPFRSIREPIEALRRARDGRIRIYRYLKGSACEEGAILVAEKGINGDQAQFASPPSTENDCFSSLGRAPVSLDEHSKQVEDWAREFVEKLNLSSHIADDLVLAAYLHDAGKADRRFQVMIAGGDEWNTPDGESPMAKSTTWSLSAWERSGLPSRWRHEALSVRMAKHHPRFQDAHDAELVLWLVGTHHGFGRPFYNFAEDADTVQPSSCLGVDSWEIDTAPGPQSLSFDFQGHDWPAMFDRLKCRYHIWGLAHLEAVLRLADHRASELGGK